MGYLMNALGNLLSETPPEEPTGDYSANVAPPSRSAASAVTMDRAVGLPGVFASISILAGVGSSLTLGGHRATGPVSPTPSLLVAPDPWRDLSDWIERFIISLATDGNTFLRKHRAATGLTAAEVLNPFLTHVRWVKGVKSYTTFDHRLGRFIDLTDADVLHVWGLQLPGHTRGVGPIEACRISLGGALDVRDYSANWFKDSDVPSGVLSSDQQLDPQTIAMYRKIWHDPSVFDGEPDAQTLNRRLGPSVRVLGKGLTYVPIMLKPADAQWIETQNFSVLDIARMWGLPPHWLHAAIEGSSLTYTTLEALGTDFMRVTYRPRYLRKIETALSALLPHGQRAEFDLAEWLRPDAKTQAEIDQIYLNTGVVSEQDVRDARRIPGTAPGKPASAPAPAPRSEIPA